MATLSLSCLSKFEPGQIGSDSGHVTVPTAEDQFPVDVYDPDTVQYSLNFSLHWNSMYQGSIV